MSLFGTITLLVLLSFLLTQPASCTLTSSSTRFTSTQLHIASPITANYSRILVRSRLACAAQCDRLPECTAFNTTRVTMETEVFASKWQTLCTLIQGMRESLTSSTENDGLFLKAQNIANTGEKVYVKVFHICGGGGPRVVVSTAAFHARVRGSVPGLGGFKETKMFLPHPRVKVSIVGSLRDREVACSASDRQGSNFESCVWRTVSSQSSHHPQEVLLAQFSLYVHKGGLKPDSFHFHINMLIC